MILEDFKKQKYLDVISFPMINRYLKQKHSLSQFQQ